MGHPAGVLASTAPLASASAVLLPVVATSIPDWLVAIDITHERRSRLGTERYYISGKKGVMEHASEVEQGQDRPHTISPLTFYIG